MSEKKTNAEMSGEALREIAVLLAVFGILDKVLRNEGPTVTWAAWVLGLSLSAFLLGCTIERKRR